MKIKLKIKGEKEDNNEAYFEVTLTMEGNLKGPLDESHLQPDLKCFYLPSQVALFFCISHSFYQQWHTGRAINYSNAPFMHLFMTMIIAAPL